MIDFKRHNEEVQELWDSFNSGKPIRTPAVMGVRTRYYVFNKEINDKGYTFRDYYNNPEVMMELQLKGQKWSRFNVVHDREMGLPDEWDGIYVDFHGITEEAWLGNEIFWSDDNVVDSWPMLQEDKNKFYDLEIPDPLHGTLMARVYEYYEYLEDKRKNFEYEGRPIGRTIVQIGTGTGLFTLATKIRGTSEVCIDMYEDPDYYHDLMNFLTEASITRTEAWCDFLGIEYPQPSWGFPDDSIQLLSKDMYRRMVLPYHKRQFDVFSKGGPNSMHICGAAHHLHKIIRDELNVQTFDCGYGTDVIAGRREVGPEVLYQWRFHPNLLCDDVGGEIEKAVKWMFDSEAREGGRFILSEVSYAGMKLDNWDRMYKAAKEYGKFN